MAREILNKEFRQRLNELGLETIHLWKGPGFFWISSDDDKCDKLIETSIYAYKFSDMTPEMWVNEIKLLLTEENYGYRL